MATPSESPFSIASAAARRRRVNHLPCSGHAGAKFVTRTFTISGGMYRRPLLRPWLAALALLMSAMPVKADSFQQMWRGRIARPPADNEEASVYWEDRW